MPKISVTGTCNKPTRPSSINQRQAAFTLLEVLLVVVIIAIVSSLAVLSVATSGDGRKTQQEARRLAILMEFARQQALLENRYYGLQIRPGGYAFLVYNKGVWQLADQPALRLRHLPRQGLIQLLSPTTEQPKQPIVMFSPLGEQDDFILQMRIQGHN